MWLTVALIGLIVALFALFVDVGQVMAQLRRARWSYTLGASALLLGGLLAYARRWQVLLADQVSFRSTLHAANLGHMTNILIPLRAGEAARVVALGRHQEVSIPTVTSSVVVERWLEQLMRLSALGAAVLLGVGMQPTPGSLLVALGVLGASIAAMMALVRSRAQMLARWPARLARLPRLSQARARQVLVGLLDGLSALTSTRQLARALFWSLAAWMCFLGFHYLALRALENGFPPGQTLALAMGALALAPPSAPTQPGIYHASVVTPLAVIGFDKETLTAYAVILHALQTLWMVGLGLWGAGRLGISPRRLLQGWATP